MIIWNWFFLVAIEAFVDRWGRSIVGDFENGKEAAAKHVGRIFKVK